jgi:hypothetical protein
MGEKLARAKAKAKEEGIGFGPIPPARHATLPAGLPDWFLQLDTDNDGQVSLYEWRRSGKTFTEFALMDRNGDGLLTAEEVMCFLAKQAHGVYSDDGRAPTPVAPTQKSADGGGPISEKGKKGGG